MTVVNLRTVAAIAVGVGVGAVLARRHERTAEPCCEKPAPRSGCC